MTSLHCSGVTLGVGEDNPNEDGIIDDRGLSDPNGVFTAELKPGRYGIAKASCSGPKVIFNHIAPDNRSFAYFDVRAGEVVDAGTAHINTLPNGSSLYSAERPATLLVFVDEEDSKSRRLRVPEGLRAKITPRLMKSNFTPDPAKLAKACDSERLWRSTYGIVGSALAVFNLEFDAPVCARLSKTSETRVQ